ncbi:MAG: hypothetical protein WCK34_10910 [Bacteroidota bacterium]
MEKIRQYRVSRRFCFTVLIFLSLFSLEGSLDAQDLAKIAGQKPFTIHGNIGLNLIGYGASGIPARNKPFSFIFNANATASIFGIELPFSITLSDKQKNYSQPFNQFGLSPHWKWITVHLGYRNVTFSNFTLAGHTFFGAGVELNPGHFRFGAVYGRFDRKTTESPIYQTDTLPHYARRGYAIKLGVGSENNFFDLVFMHIKDDSTSLAQHDSTALRTPAQNIVTGINSRFTLVKNLVLEVEGAVSLYTTNLGAKQFSDIEKDPTLRSMNKFLSINQSSEYYTAVRSALHYKGKTWGLKLEYRRIDPKYQSMGAYFFNNDVQNLTIAPSFFLFKRKLVLVGSLGLQNDNLKKTKRATSSRTIGSLNISWNPVQKFGIDGSYSNYSISQKSGRIPLTDTTRVYNTTQNFSLTPRLIFINKVMSHMFLVVYNLANFTDKNKVTAGMTKFTSQTTQLNYILGLLKHQWSFTFGALYLSLDSKMAGSKSFGGNFGVGKSLFSGSLSLNWNNSLVSNDNGGTAGTTFNSNFSGNYRIRNHHNFRISIFYTKNSSSKVRVNPAFTEFKGDLGYVFTF